MTAIFLDFDGVLCDSIGECFGTSKTAYRAYAGAGFDVEGEECRAAFWRNRGLVGPVPQYLALWRAIEGHLRSGGRGETSLAPSFREAVRALDLAEGLRFEREFFAARAAVRDGERERWLAMHAPTDLGRCVAAAEPGEVYIITTKDEASVEVLLRHMGIRVQRIFGSEDFRRAGTKGRLISAFLDETARGRAIFVDDSVEHLRTVRDPRVECLFAPWGYGENDGFAECSYSRDARGALVLGEAAPARR